VLDAGSFSLEASEPHHTLDLPPESADRFYAGSFSSGAPEQHVFDFLPEATDRRITFVHAGEARIVSVGCH